MLPPNRLGRFFLILLLCYAALMAPWPGLQRGYAYLFREVGNVVFARFWFTPDGSVRFRDLEAIKPGDLPPGAPSIDATVTFDTVMELRSQRAPGKIGFLRTSSRYLGYVPTVVLLALILATPLRRRRKGAALIAGALLIHAFIALRLTLTLLAGGFAASKEYALFHPSPLMRTALTKVESVLSDNPTVSFVVPAFLWFLVALTAGVRPGDDGARTVGKPRASDGQD